MAEMSPAPPQGLQHNGLHRPWKPKEYLPYPSGPNSTSPDEFLKLIDEVRNCVKEAGLRLNESSRLEMYRKYILRTRQSDGAMSANSENFAVCHRLFLEVPQLALVCRELSRPPAVAGWESKMEIVLAGGLTPESEADTAARDAQLELLLAAALRKGGAEVALAEPDVIVAFEDLKLGIAAKRITSPKKANRRLREARNQIERANIDGIVALDISAAFDTGNYVETDDTKYCIALEPQLILGQFMGDHASARQQILHGSRVVGTLVLGHFLGVKGNGESPSTCFTFNFAYMCKDDDPRLSPLRRMLSALSVGNWYPNPQPATSKSPD
jgi:hypothetical protein